VGAVFQLGRGEGFEQRDRRPATVGGAREQVIQIVGAARQAEAAQLATQGRGGDRG